MKLLGNIDQSLVRLKLHYYPVVEARNLYRYRTRVAKYKDKFKNSYESIACPMCLVQPDTQCPEVKTRQMWKAITVISSQKAFPQIYLEHC